LSATIAAIVLVGIFAAGLGLAVSLAVGPLDLSHIGLSEIPSGVIRSGVSAR
jgi:hypothetical protein